MILAIIGLFLLRKQDEELAKYLLISLLAFYAAGLLAFQLGWIVFLRQPVFHLPYPVFRAGFGGLYSGTCPFAKEKAKGDGDRERRHGSSYSLELGFHLPMGHAYGPCSRTDILEADGAQSIRRGAPASDTRIRGLF